jgi:hypothetical protein
VIQRVVGLDPGRDSSAERGGGAPAASSPEPQRRAVLGADALRPRAGVGRPGGQSDEFVSGRPLSSPWHPPWPVNGSPSGRIPRCSASAMRVRSGTPWSPPDPGGHTMTTPSTARGTSHARPVDDPGPGSGTGRCSGRPVPPATRGRSRTRRRPRPGSAARNSPLSSYAGSGMDAEWRPIAALDQRVRGSSPLMAHPRLLSSGHRAGRTPRRPRPQETHPRSVAAPGRAPGDRGVVVPHSALLARRGRPTRGSRPCPGHRDGASVRSPSPGW